MQGSIVVAACVGPITRKGSAKSQVIVEATPAELSISRGANLMIYCISDPDLS
jgi:hypothetical protein